MTARWTFAIGPGNADGGMDWDLTNARSRRATFRLTGNSEASFTLDGRHTDATKVHELTTDLHLLRAGEGELVATRLFRGRIGQTGDTLSPDVHTMTAGALDYRALLQRRILWSDSQLTWTGAAQYDIAWGLISQTQARVNGDLGILPGIGQGLGPTRDRTYEAGDSIGQRIQELSEVIDGFDWDIGTPSASELTLDAWSERGEDRGVVLEYGGLVSDVQRTVNPSDYANAVRVSGTAPSSVDDAPTGDPPVPVELDADDLASRPEGRWDAAVGESITTQDALAERAAWRVGQSEVVQPAYQVTLKSNGWRGPGHIWLGDPVRLVIYSGRLAVDGRLRVQEIDVTISDDGEETVVLTLGARRPDFRRWASDVDRRLATLERR